MEKKRGFTLIEIMVVVTIIGILALAIFISVNESRKKARINAAKTSLQSVLPIMISCLDSKGTITGPDLVNKGGNQICNTINGANWSTLANSYAYVSLDVNSAGTCGFVVSTNNDTATNRLTCSCVTQVCE